MRQIGRLLIGTICATLIALGAVPAAQADFDDPTFVYTPRPNPPERPIPPSTGYLEGPCGLAVDAAANYYVADYHQHNIDIFGPDPTAVFHDYRAQLTGVDSLDGPCGMALDSANRLYVNDYHRDVVRFSPSSFPPTESTAFGAPTTIDAEHPTGVAIDLATDIVYVDNRTYVSAYEPSGAPVEVSGEPLRIGAGSLQDGYGLAFSKGRLYVPDAASNTVKVFEPALDTVNPVMVIDGDDVPGGDFTSLRDAAVAVDDASGQVYVADNLQPAYLEEPEAAIYVFDASGAYLGRLKHNIVDALPPGLAVDNSAEETQGRVYVTSGNTEIASIYAYPPGAATSKVVVAKKQLGEAPRGTPLPAATFPAALASAAAFASAEQASPPGPRAQRRQRAKHRRLGVSQRRAVAKRRVR